MGNITLLATTAATIAISLALYTYIRMQKYNMKKFVLRSGGFEDYEYHIKRRGKITGK